MGLDASVRCRCFEEHKLTPGPVPYEDLYVDEEGYLSSRRLDEGRRRYRSDRRRFDARYGLLEIEFEAWVDHCCEHEYGDWCNEWVSNWAGAREFEDLVEAAGGEGEFPLLSHLIPSGNGGTHPAELAGATLAELDRFVARLADLDEYVLLAEDSGDVVWSVTDGGSHAWMYSRDQRIFMTGGRVVFEGPGDNRVETTCFRQEPTGDPDDHGAQRMRIVCLDQDAVTTSFDSIGPFGAPKVARDFQVAKQTVPFLCEGRYPVAERIRSLLEASVETGNPIRWE